MRKRMKKIIGIMLTASILLCESSILSEAKENIGLSENQNIAEIDDAAIWEEETVLYSGDEYGEGSLGIENGYGAENGGETVLADSDCGLEPPDAYIILNGDLGEVQADNEESNSSDIPATPVDAELGVDDMSVQAPSNTYTVTSTITATLSDDGTFTVSGAGEMPRYSFDDLPPWYNNRSSIKKVVIANGITSVGGTSFYDCDNCTEISIAGTVTTIGYGAFADCPVTTMTGGGGLRTIEDYAFQNSRFASFVFPDSVQTLGKYIFFGNSNLQTITIPANVTDVFAVGYGCSGITDYVISSGNRNYTSDNGAIYTKDKRTLIAYPSARTAAPSFPAQVTRFESYAFANSNANSVTVPSGVTELGEGVFAKSNIKKLVISDSVTKVGNYVCQDAKYLETVVVGSGITEYGYRQFSGCSSLKNVTVGKNVRDLGGLAFADCTSLETIVLPEGLENIMNGTFGNCSKLKSVTLPESLTGIYYQAFLNCSSLNTIKLPSKLAEINRYAFYGTAINEITIPETVTYIGENAFPRNTVLKFERPLKKLESGAYADFCQAPVAAQYRYDYAFEVLRLVNQERAKDGKSSLTMDKSLLDSAMLRAVETSALFSHTRPTGENCFTANEKMFGENIAINWSPENVMTSWMNSSGHRANILNASYKSIGIGVVCVDGTYYWVQCFGSAEADAASESGYANYSNITNIEFLLGTEDIDIVANRESFSGVQGEQIGTLQLYFSNGFTTTVIDNSGVSYSVVSGSSCTVSADGTITGTGGGTSTVRAALKNYPDRIYADATVSVTGKTIQMPDRLQPDGIYVFDCDRNGVFAGIVMSQLNSEQKTNVEYQWVITKDGGKSWILAADWTRANEFLSYQPKEFGDYVVVAKVRIVGRPDTETQVSSSFSYHPHIKGICQMPYEGGGYLIGIESYDNPNNEYSYEMLILDCTLLAAGKDAWTYTTGRCGTTGNCLWTIWQPQYGYYWTLFRVYDKNGVLIDEQCYGFANIC